MIEIADRRYAVAYAHQGHRDCVDIHLADPLADVTGAEFVDLSRRSCSASPLAPATDRLSYRCVLSILVRNIKFSRKDVVKLWFNVSYD